MKEEQLKCKCGSSRFQIFVVKHLPECDTLDIRHHDPSKETASVICRSCGKEVEGGRKKAILKLVDHMEWI